MLLFCNIKTKSTFSENRRKKTAIAKIIAEEKSGVLDSCHTRSYKRICINYNLCWSAPGSWTIISKTLWVLIILSVATFFVSKNPHHFKWTFNNDSKFEQPSYTSPCYCRTKSTAASSMRYRFRYAKRILNKRKFVRCCVTSASTLRHKIQASMTKADTINVVLCKICVRIL